MACLTVCVMAVQPDKRPWDQLVEANGWQQTERFRVGIWTLTASKVDVDPRSYNVRCDRPGFPKGTSVSWSPHDGWVMWDGDEKFVTRASPVACLEWWVARR